MSTGVSIRAAADVDLQALLALQQRYPQVAQWTEAVWSRMLGNDGTPLRRIWLADKAGALAGFVVLSLAGDIAEFEMVLVDEAVRGQGHGRALCETAMQWAIARGARHIELEVRSSNAAARALYLSLGFAEQGVRSNYYRHPMEDAVLMGVTL
jgi:ribosomal-protein-alanine N-acetyltransferase